MIIDYISDLHLDYYIHHFKKMINTFENIFTNNNTRKCGDVLVIAGDLSHNPEDIFRTLKAFKKYYKYIVCVLGNHDYYMVDLKHNIQYKNSLDKANKLIVAINSIPNVYCLDGTTITLEGITFGGACGWYSNDFLNSNFKNKTFSVEENLNMWKEAMPDYKGLRGITHFNELYAIEKLKIEKVYNKCDIMITHFNPSIKKEHQSPRYAISENSTFFCFDGSKFLNQGTMSHWIFGHTHDIMTNQYNEINCVCNAIGYPSESGYLEWVQIESFEIFPSKKMT